MGINVERVVGNNVNSNLICPICLGVLQDPLQDSNEHSFCSTCINRWLDTNQECPVDRSLLTKLNLKPISRLLQNLLSDLDIYCEYKSNGCNSILKINQITIHPTVCQYNPDKPSLCSSGCGAVIARNDLLSHNCVKELRKECKELTQLVSFTSQQFKVELKQMQTKLSELSTMISVMYRDDLFRTRCSEFLTNLTNRSKGTIRDVSQIVEDYECELSVKENLIQLKCPPDVAEEICKNSNELKWPGPLSYSTSRKIHETQIKSMFGFDIAKTGYVILILPHLNRHLPIHFTKEPGFLIKLISYDSMIRS